MGRKGSDVMERYLPAESSDGDHSYRPSAPVPPALAACSFQSGCWPGSATVPMPTPVVDLQLGRLDELVAVSDLVKYEQVPSDRH